MKLEAPAHASRIYHDARRKRTGWVGAPKGHLEQREQKFRIPSSSSTLEVSLDASSGRRTRSRLCAASRRRSCQFSVAARRGLAVE